MFKIENEDLEYPTLAPNSKVGYDNEFKTYEMVSGKIRRVYIGKRFNATIKYGYLTPQQVSKIADILAIQRTKGYVDIQIDTAFGTYTGGAFLSVGNQSRFGKVNNQLVWTNYEITLVGADLV